MRSRLVGVIVCLVAAGALAPAARATNPIYNHWKALYPDSKTDDNIIAGAGVGCQTCHVSDLGSEPWNAYGFRVRQGIVSGLSVDNAILAAESFDSDSDPTHSTNIEELLADSQPGWKPDAVNMWFFANGSTQGGKNPPAGVAGTLDPVWTKLLDAALAGVNGLPDLKGVGQLKPNLPMALNLGGGAPLAATFMLVGLSELDAPFKGGTLVPAVDLLIPLVTNPTGNVSVQATWPVGVPPGFDFWVQCWIVDAAGPKGFSASNGLKGTAN